MYKTDLKNIKSEKDIDILLKHVKQNKKIYNDIEDTIRKQILLDKRSFFYKNNISFTFSKYIDKMISNKDDFIKIWIESLYPHVEYFDHIFKHISNRYSLLEIIDQVIEDSYFKYKVLKTLDLDIYHFLRLQIVYDIKEYHVIWDILNQQNDIDIDIIEDFLKTLQDIKNNPILEKRFIKPYNNLFNICLKYIIHGNSEQFSILEDLHDYIEKSYIELFKDPRFIVRDFFISKKLSIKIPDNNILNDLYNRNITLNDREIYESLKAFKIYGKASLTIDNIYYFNKYFTKHFDKLVNLFKSEIDNDITL